MGCMNVSSKVRSVINSKMGKVGSGSLGPHVNKRDVFPNWTYFLRQSDEHTFLIYAYKFVLMFH